VLRRVGEREARYLQSRGVLVYLRTDLAEGAVRNENGAFHRHRQIGERFLDGAEDSDHSNVEDASHRSGSVVASFGRRIFTSSCRSVPLWTDDEANAPGDGVRHQLKPSGVEPPLTDSVGGRLQRGMTLPLGSSSCAIDCDRYGVRTSLPNTRFVYAHRFGVTAASYGNGYACPLNLTVPAGCCS
jgi:hypothetical protein